ncbi:UDP-glucose/GDP-mannose dehydrogenase family protein [Cytobacillus firmus]|uniref:UDP-glucose dehydrogenase family protein n=1 Tax=Cytobacillus firmus TaxID=1399 RepID=UPI001C8D0FA7|nr:UDP-glucose/GDP-mannose dehydrogenase family protein [Cytobacillus firmus]MBX9974037.1 UDP-glucose/GDP-mannose dehydrogenase family protein [Cytobacillus firmus]
MKICIIGAGYVGLVTGSSFAELGYEVVCVDINPEIIEKLKNGIIPIYEPGLEEMVKKNSEEGRLTFTTDIRKAIQSSLFIFIAVGTPSAEDHSADLTHIFNAAEQIGSFLNHYSIIINKSTVPIGTSKKVKEIVSQALNRRDLADLHFDVVSNPEFLREGKAIKDFLNPDRIIVGSDNLQAIDHMKRLYKPITSKGFPFLVMDLPSAELTKYAANAMLATRISFMNEIAAISDAYGADIQMVQEGIGIDHRIGHAFLSPGIGYGGSCFPKDVKSLIKAASDKKIPTPLLESVEKVNQRQRKKLFEMIIEQFGKSDLSMFKFAVWGLAFKPETDDIREAPSIDIIRKIIQHGAKVHACDPAANQNVRKVFGDERIKYFQDPYSAITGADALIICTEWPHFQLADLGSVKKLLRNPIIFDGRNIYEPKELQEAGFVYKCFGRNI